jgi:hypothetical protein
MLETVDARFFTLALDVVGSRNARASLRRICEPEELRGENRFFDTRSRRRVDARFTTTFVQAPQILVCHLRRFEFDPHSGRKAKVDNRFDFDFELTLPHVDAAYELSGVVLHCGTTDSGHYRSIVRSAGKWLMADDSQVYEISERDVKQQGIGGTARGWSAYLLFYTRAGLAGGHARVHAECPALRELEGAGTLPIAQFVKTMEDDVRWLYFLRVICRSPDLELAQEFAPAVTRLPDLYAPHFREIVARVSENAALAGVVESVLLSGISAPLLDAVGDAVELIAEKRHTVEWFGQLLSKAHRECPCAVLIVQHVAERFPRRGDDLSAYLRFWQSLPGMDWDAIEPLLPFLVNHVSSDLAPALAARIGNWDSLRELYQGQSAPFDFALQILSRAETLPRGIEETISTPDFALHLLNLSLAGNDSAIVGLAKWAGDIFFPALTDPHLKVLRRQTAGIITKLFLPGDVRCLRSLVKCHREVRAPLGSNSGRYVSYFRVLKEFSSTGARDTLKPLVGLQSILLQADTAFKRDLLEFDSLILGRLSISPDEFSAMFTAFFALANRFAPADLQRALAVFLPHLRASAMAITRLLLSDAFYALVEHVARADRDGEFVVFVRTQMGRSAACAAALADAFAGE